MARATRIVDAFNITVKESSAAIHVDGQLVDYPIVARVKRILDLAARAGVKATQ